MAKSRKLPMKMRENMKQRSVSFTKRRQGLFNKAAELFMFCGAQLAIFVSSPSSKPNRKFYSFGQPSVAAVLEAYLRNCLPFSIDHYQVKRYALRLLDVMESEQDFPSSSFEFFENSESIEELRKLIRALEELIDKAKRRFNDDNDWNSPNSALIDAMDQSNYKTCPTSKLSSIDELSICYSFDAYSVFPSPESAYCYEFKGEEGSYCNMINDAVPEFDFLNSCYAVNGEMRRNNDNRSLSNHWTCTSLCEVAAELINSNEFGFDSNATANDNEDPFWVDDFLWY